MVELRKLNLSKKWTKELNEWKEKNKEIFLKLNREECDIVLMNWLIGKLDEQEEIFERRLNNLIIQSTKPISELMNKIKELGGY